ncbi:hypothetical protein D1007_54792 [Hordeum vulgare]|nr:hypothetical protein D1007_54792 [Hordeum vulgare]
MALPSTSRGIMEVDGDAMEVDGNGDVLAVSPRPACGKKRPLSPSIPPNDVADSPKSSTSDEDDNPWALSDDEEEDEYHGTYHPFTVDDFARVSSDDDEQRVAVYLNPEISIRGPRPIMRFPAFKPESRHSCDIDYRLADESENPPEDGPKGDLLIEGCIEFSNMYETKSSIQNRRLYGDKCSLDVKFAALVNAVQAFVDVEILRAPDCGLNLNPMPRPVDTTT